MTTLELDVVGTPAPQGSKKGFYNKGLGRVQMVESSKKVAPWRQDVKAAALNAIADRGDWTVPQGPVAIEVTFYVARPAGHYGTGRNAGRLKDSAPVYPAVKPDIDKLQRSTFDALGEAGCWADDSRVVMVSAQKLYADGRQPGAEIEITPLNSTPVLTTGPGTGVDLDTVAAVVGDGSHAAATVQEALL